jgi:hypothetical protein
VKPDVSNAQDCVQDILWNIIGYSQCGENATINSPKVVWKNNQSLGLQKTAPPPLTKDECSEVSMKAWSHLCHLVHSTIEDVSAIDDTAERTIQQWSRLLVFVRHPSISNDFKVLADSSYLQNIATALADLPKDEEATATISVEKTENEDEKVRNEKVGKQSRRQRIVSNARKVLKEYKLYYQGTFSGSSKTD